ncbi:1-deoxy-D-xylulose-5-phosphate reductoisomerase [Taibaiella chishuiensis]|uniref:1-deoxy-D-xylulose 5-phosphate reductoisomerase n=1 Tax=Taibaiella chishuiensis TaxID=1434707 RepID=A0A2P8D4D9_9BACT|nr:1-deoxy-D-xylulose-5-phosphate reductoisomerase [Taibaiella chishuiensis]PSK92081.1 1-deoxy-D-xylulose 5-phosphate reductoisomerase [Taibaiella chishuiensis]
MKKRLAILGSTGSVGTQALEVVDQHPGLFTVEILSAHSNDALLIEQAAKYKPNAVVVTDETKYDTVKSALANSDIKVFCGAQSLCEVVQWDSVDLVLAAIVGFAGLHSTVAALQAGKQVAIANKETLVVAGEIVMKLAQEKNILPLPVDSEHSALFQCLVGERADAIEKIILTASGGPFLGKKTNFLVNVKKDHALQHPNWAMGAKITIDSATLMNKGLEMIEAKWLFGLQNEQIDVVIHPQSIIHSLVQFRDGSLKAQMGLPDMKLPIQYALGYPQRLSNDFKRFDFREYGSFTFEAPDYKTFRNLALAKDAMYKGGNAPCVLNAANEVVVNAFLQNKVGFLEMNDIIESALQKISFIEAPVMADLEQTDAETRKFTESLVKKSQLYS